MSSVILEIKEAEKKYKDFIKRIKEKGDNLQEDTYIEFTSKMIPIILNYNIYLLCLYIIGGKINKQEAYDKYIELQKKLKYDENPNIGGLPRRRQYRNKSPFD